MRARRIAWMTAAKLVVTLALMLPANRGEPVEYRTLAELPGLSPGSPVTLAGQPIGQVVRSERRGDTTVLRIRFRRGVERLPGSRIVQLRRMGLDGSEVVALEMRRAPRGTSRSFARGGLLHVRPPDLEYRPDPRPDWYAPPQPPVHRLIPPAPPARLSPRFVST
ncbi:MAG: MlaD family protein [Gemmatimonadaceae bacterium]